MKEALLRQILGDAGSILLNRDVEPCDCDLLLASGIVAVGRHPTGVDGVATHAVLGPFERHAAGEPKKARFRGAVGAVPDITNVGSGRGDVDYAPPLAFNHTREATFDRAIGTVEVR